MNLILLACLLLFIIYLSIAGLLVYYFFRARDIWNIFFDEIYQDVLGIAQGCPQHNTIGIFIPGFIYSNSNDVSDSASACIGCARESKERESDIYNIKLLGRIYNEFKVLDNSIFDDVEISSRCKMFLQILEYIIRNYRGLHNGDYRLYESLQIAYLDKAPNNKTCKPSRGIEIIPTLEEYCKAFNRLDAICSDIDIAMVESTFMIAFYKEIREFVIKARDNLNLHLNF